MAPCLSLQSSGFVTGSRVAARAPLAARPARAVVAVSARYRGEGTDRSRVPEFKRHASDVGSPEVQIAQLSARVEQLTGHLQANPKDYACTRGLMTVLGKRRNLLRYLNAQDPAAFERVVKDLGIRNPIKTLS